MKEYESVFVLNPSVDDAQVDTELEKIKEFLTSKNSEITEVQKWGRRKLAYEIGKNREGIYTLIRFNADASVPTELDRRYRLNENMLRYLTVLYERPAIEEGAEEGAEAAAGQDTPAETKEPAAKTAAPVEEPAEPESEAKAEGHAEAGAEGKAEAEAPPKE